MIGQLHRTLQSPSLRSRPNSEETLGRPEQLDAHRMLNIWTSETQTCQLLGVYKYISLLSIVVLYRNTLQYFIWDLNRYTADVRLS